MNSLHPNFQGYGKKKKKEEELFVIVDGIFNNNTKWIPISRITDLDYYRGAHAYEISKICTIGLGKLSIVERVQHLPCNASLSIWLFFQLILF